MKIQVNVKRLQQHQFTSTILAHHETIKTEQPCSLKDIIINALNTAAEKGYTSLTITWAKTKMYPSPEHKLVTEIELRRNPAKNAPLTCSYIYTKDTTAGKVRTWTKTLEGVHTIASTIEGEGFRIVNSPS